MAAAAWGQGCSLRSSRATEQGGQGQTWMYSGDLSPGREQSPQHSPGSPYQCIKALSEKKCFLISNLNLPWCDFRLFLLVLVLEKVTSRPPPCCLPTPTVALPAVPLRDVMGWGVDVAVGRTVPLHWGLLRPCSPICVGLLCGGSRGWCRLTCLCLESSWLSNSRSCVVRADIWRGAAQLIKFKAGLKKIIKIAPRYCTAPGRLCWQL